MYSIGQIISNYRKRNGYSQPELAAALIKENINISYKTISSWEKGKSEPSVTTFLTLCKVLHIADVYEEYFGVNPGNALSQLNDEGKEKVMEYTDLLISSGKYEKEKAEIIPFPTRELKLYTTMVSAGTGNFLDGTDFEMIEVGDEVPENADFGVKITGDSMEPKYINHQIVWVHQQDSLMHGEIGIFCLNGDAFCKKLQDDNDGLFLISLNKKYPPKPVGENDSLTIFGKVVG